MSLLPLAGRARRLGDDVNTDGIIASRRKRETIDPALLKRHLLEDAAPGFAASVRPGDILVAGRNFGCGSAMEVAVTVVLAAGIRAVVAKSFARTYLRNALNNGLFLCVADTTGIGESDPIAINATESGLAVAGAFGRRPCDPVPPFMLAMLEAGGLVPYLRAHGRFPSQAEAVSQ